MYLTTIIILLLKRTAHKPLSLCRIRGGNINNNTYYVNDWHCFLLINFQWIRLNENETFTRKTTIDFNI